MQSDKIYQIALFFIDLLSFYMYNEGVFILNFTPSLSIDIIKNEIWDPYDYPNLDRDIWEKQTIEEIKSIGQILKHLEERIRELKKHIKKLNKEQNERNNTKQFM